MDHQDSLTFFDFFGYSSKGGLLACARKSYRSSLIIESLSQSLKSEI